MIFTAIATALLSGTFLAGTAAVGILAGGLSLAASIGISYAAAALAGKPKSPEAQHFSVQTTLQQAGDVPRSFNLGYSATAGSLVYGNYWGNSGGTPNAYLTQVIAIGDLPGGTLQEVWINGVKCTLGDVADPDMGFPVVEYNKDGADHIWIKYYDGTQTVADPFLVAKVGSTAHPYENTRVGVGVSYVIATSLVNDTLYTGEPLYTFAHSGIPLYDPTKDDTNGGTGSHRYSDPSTWGGDGDNLPAVQAYNVLRGFYYAGAWVYGFQSMTAPRLPNVNWNVQIDKCRATVTGASGDEPAYRSGGQVNVSAQIGNTLQTLLTTCQGKLSEIGGFYKLHLGEPDSPTFSFTDDDILSTEEQNFAPFFGLADSINGISATYPDPAQAWAMVPAPKYTVDAMVTRDGGRQLLANPSFDFVPYAEQVQRLQKSAVNEAARERRHTVVLPPHFWLVEPGDVGQWTSARNGYVTKLVRADGVTDRANLDVGLNLTEVDPSDYDWDTSTDYKPVEGGSTVIQRPAPQGIKDWFADGVSIKDSAGNNRRPAIHLEWDGDMPGVIGVRYAVRLKSDSTFVTSGSTDQLAAAAIIISQSLLPNTQYQVQGQYIPSAPRDMLWSDWLDVTTPDTRLTALDFDPDALAASVSNQFQIGDDKVSSIVQIVAAVTAQILAKSSLDKKVLRTELSAQSGRLSSSITQVQTVAASNTEALADFTTTVTAQFDEQTAQIQESATAVADINNNLAASWGLLVNADGAIASLQALAGGGTSALVFLANLIKFAIPDATGGEAVDIFQIATVDGVPKIVFKGDMYGDGFLQVQHLSSGDVSALFASFGTMQAGIIQSPDGKYVNNLTTGQETWSD